MKKINLIFIIVCAVSNDAVIARTAILFSHGIADTHKQAFAYASRFFPCSWATFDYPDATDGLLRVNYKETSFGQANEMVRLYDAYEKVVDCTCKKSDTCNIILFGLSRGASNISIFAGSYQIDNVRAIVLESPYYSMKEVIKHIMDKSNLGWLSLSYGQSVAEFIFKKYSRYGISPADTLAHIPKHIPVLIICSQEDQLVPCSSSINLYKKLKECGHEHTYILILEKGQHAKIIIGPENEKYESVIHAFYKKYNLPHNPSVALNGDTYLSECQPIL